VGNKLVTEGNFGVGKLTVSDGNWIIVGAGGASFISGEKERGIFRIY